LMGFKESRSFSTAHLETLQVPYMISETISQDHGCYNTLKCGH